MSPSAIVVMNGSNSKRVSRSGHPGESQDGEEGVALKLNLTGGTKKLSSEDVILPLNSKNERVEAVAGAVDANTIE